MRLYTGDSRARIPVERIVAHLAHTPDGADRYAANPELSVEELKGALFYARAVVERQDQRSTDTSTN